MEGNSHAAARGLGAPRAGDVRETDGPVGGQVCRPRELSREAQPPSTSRERGTGGVTQPRSF